MKIGVLGGEPMGVMLALAGIRMGHSFRFFDPTPAGLIGGVGELHTGAYADTAALDRFASGLDVVTFTREDVPRSALKHLEQHVSVYPSPGSLELCQDRLAEKLLFESLDIPVAKYREVSSIADVVAARAEWGMAVVLKTCGPAGQGKSHRVIQSEEEILDAWAQIANGPMILERSMPVERELSILVARNREGETVSYPLTENYHVDGGLRVSLAPASGPTLSLQLQARQHATKIIEKLNYVGVIAIEFIQSRGKLIANELSTHIHESGRWTIEGATTSQFENHLRAILGLPLGTASAVGHTATINLIGAEPNLNELLAIPNVHFHWYGLEPKPGRVLGHATVTALDIESFAASQARLHIAANLEI